MLAISIASLLGIAAAAGMGCGGDGQEAGYAPVPPPVLGEGIPDEVAHPVTAAIDELQRAFEDGDYASICGRVTSAAARQAGEAAHGDATRCAADVKRMMGLIREGGGFRHGGAPRVIDVETAGSTAVATVALDRRWKARIPLAREDGRWRLSGFFGANLAQAKRAARAIEGADFPAADGEPLEVVDRNGEPCPELAEDRYPVVGGGCRLRVRGPVRSMVILTAFGDFRFDECSLAYDARIDASGRAWTEELTVQGPQTSAGCGDVNACYDYATEAPAPWRGRIHRGANGTLLHRMDMCLQTCVGNFIGELTIRLVPTDDGWRAEPVDGGGDTGFRFDTPLRVDTEIQVET